MFIVITSSVLGAIGVELLCGAQPPTNAGAKNLGVVKVESILTPTVIRTVFAPPPNVAVWSVCSLPLEASDLSVSATTDLV
jgi:hypothetical protein